MRQRISAAAAVIGGMAVGVVAGGALAQELPPPIETSGDEFDSVSEWPPVTYSYARSTGSSTLNVGLFAVFIGGFPTPISDSIYEEFSLIAEDESTLKLYRPFTAAVVALDQSLLDIEAGIVSAIEARDASTVILREVLVEERSTASGSSRIVLDHAEQIVRHIPTLFRSQLIMREQSRLDMREGEARNVSALDDSEVLIGFATISERLTLWQRASALIFSGHVNLAQLHDQSELVITGFATGVVRAEDEALIEVRDTGSISKAELRDSVVLIIESNAFRTPQGPIEFGDDTELILFADDPLFEDTDGLVSEYYFDEARSLIGLEFGFEEGIPQRRASIHGFRNCRDDDWTGMVILRLSEDQSGVEPTPPCIGDANGRGGGVDFGDLTSVLDHWGNRAEDFTDPCDRFFEGDANFDGVVDFGDITAVLGNWLSVCP